MVSLSIKELRHKLQRTAPEGASETYVGKSVRFFSIYLTKAVSATRATPNQITFLGVLIFLSGVSVFLFRSYALNFLGVALIYVSIIFDAADGEVARLKGNQSGIGGSYVEPLSHDFQYALMFIPLTLSVYISTSEVVIVYVGFAATVFKLLHRFLTIRFEHVFMMKNGTSRDAIGSDEKYISLPHKIYKFFNRNIFSSVGLPIPLLVFVILDRVDLFIWFFAIGFFVIFAANFAYQMKYIIKH
ncbi:MAG: hypothetical protein A3G52_03495 [Candidatus Taylorbacteria bacterium RIFCSPLOWO2_12_FULL_43_20]|uniref:CDP-alcohol phosphatidyltransferase n=1 Tax=Candidatus Taylorbacteria bacterium RIFCSPLOWO2_12_FULL_43_20 TaxID=1802332 RepID=A0A1G2P0S2_9BACT|nr:MAG: hypothetical protein A2825_02440 [Candidatus Taylorbacteria bacterium RIFCSPHIGHO2_01_FULL_43_120]OHA22412.1 MAG: hypothetical protein A3B98_02340 [Candidatus Taylorbacteria bacterium RIFCSPHIGHO2_02_FULL_43_55]OHA28351.1 MAG: hypothetical protein A3E92_00510 [Candidatus Taylorbacteria bacterium RIFCSPHIGHO2_12_FULL_42_34]OHA30625.1 MAG: hypothetical protein A3B09_00390 [Candidatus Taylorbacteria bacterium RIFCSPLOWO2_01_FULL_43_83]OHA38522.1 MAG: hypothetical protein A3H58_03035 [Candi